MIKGAREDLAAEAVIGRLAPLLKMTAEMVRPRFMSGSFTVKKAVDLATAEKYRAYLEQLGCVCAIEREDAAPAPSPANTARAAAQPEMRTASPAIVPANASTKVPTLALELLPNAAPAAPGEIATPPAAPSNPSPATGAKGLAPAPKAALAAQATPEPVYVPPKEHETFAVRFDMRQPLNKGAKKRHPLSGKGEITFTEEGLHIRAKRPRRFWFAASEDFVIPYADLLDAKVTGKLVRFSADGLALERRDLCFAVADMEEAFEIVELLPKRQSDEFRQHQDDEEAFEDSLDEVGTVPIVTYALVAVNIAVLLVMMKKGIVFFFADPDMAIDFGTNYGPLTMSGQWWRLVSACFIHFGILHLVFSMIVLHNVGRLVEKLYGSVHFLLLYTIAGLSGGVLSLLWHPTFNSAGASGAIFGIFGGLLAYMMMGSNGVPQTIMQEHRSSIFAFVGYSLYKGLTRSGIDLAANIGGLIGGLVMGYLLMRPLNAEARKAPALPKLAGGALAGMVMLALAGFPLYHPSERVKQDLNFLAQVRLINKEQAKAEGDYEELAAKVDSGQMTQLQMAEPIERQILPQWQAMNTQLSAIPLSESSSLYSQEQELLQYIDGEQRRLQQLVQDIRSNDKGAIQQANEAEFGGAGPQDEPDNTPEN